MRYIYNNLTGVRKIRTKVRALTIGGAAGIVALATAIGLPFAAHAAPTQVVVTPSNTQGWSTSDTRPGGAVNYVADPTAPGTPHTGALQLTTDATTTSKAQYMHASSTPLSQVTELSYATKQNSASFAQGDASYQVPVCLGGATSTTCTGFTTLVYEPYENGTVTAGNWQTWDVAAGQFWSSRSYTDGANCTVGAGGGGAPFYTLADLKAACPSAVVAGFGVNIGSNNPSYDVEADLVNFNGTTYNFEPYVVLNNKEQCFHDGYKTFTNPSFKNQGQCVRWVEAHANGNLHLANPSQQITFNVTNDVTKEGNHNTVSYTNFDYPGGLSYQANVTCSYVNPETKEARFMFQIPDGHPGLSGLYVVAYAKEVRGAQPDLYGHAATADLATATQWCQTGTGFSPTMYTITQGRVEIEG